MKSIISHFVFLILFTGISTAIAAKEWEEEPSEKLIFNMVNLNELPRSFRTTSYVYSPEIIKRKGFVPSDAGLRKLRMSGSSQFSKDSLEVILNTVDKNKNNIYVVDLRQEIHGFVNGHAISWYAKRNWGNVGMSSTEIENQQHQRLVDLFSQRIASFFLDKKSDTLENIEVDRIENEETIAQGLGSHYRRFYVTDHTRPADKTVDEFISFVKKLPKNAWLHFHCKGGKGRTTTFMSMYDMIHNAGNVSFEEIVLRQWFIGGINLFTDEMDESWKVEYAEARINFLRDFYKYCRENPTFNQEWSYWVNS
ncbi:MAG: hypothetical protein WC222_09930 [Parachlamydiales bacterium]|jgi:hypothetical protein